MTTLELATFKSQRHASIWCTHQTYTKHLQILLSIGTGLIEQLATIPTPRQTNNEFLWISALAIIHSLATFSSPHLHFDPFTHTKSGSTTRLPAQGFRKYDETFQLSVHNLSDRTGWGILRSQLRLVVPHGSTALRTQL